MNGIVIIGALAAMALICAAAKEKKMPMGLYRYDVDAEDIREGVQNGWYTCQLTTKNGDPAVILSGKMTNGEDYRGVFTISERDWNALKHEGYEVVEL